MEYFALGCVNTIEDPKKLPRGYCMLNLETSVGSQKSTQALNAPSQLKNWLITRKVTTQFFNSLFLTVAISISTAAADSKVEPAPNGLTLPEGYKDWRVIASSHRTDNNTLRIIIGNDTAIEAARNGEVNPWPDGTILGKLVWKDRQDDNWEKATVPGQFVHAEFMFKKPRQFKETEGWGYARWLGLAQKPYGKDATFSQECYGCHQPVKGRDYVFTTPAKIP